MDRQKEMETIASNCRHFIEVVSDIREHMPKLLELSVKCESIAEVGVRHAVSTWAFLYGLCLNQKEKKQLYCLDVFKPNCLDNIQELTTKVGIEFEFYIGNSATTPLPVVDMMFIDTWHVYAHLIRELEFHHSRVRKYFVLHDTEIDRIMGESIREKHNIENESKEYGYPPQEIMMGLSFAIDEFLERHPEWRFKKHYPNNNGMTILERVDDKMAYSVLR